MRHIKPLKASACHYDQGAVTLERCLRKNPGFFLSGSVGGALNWLDEYQIGLQDKRDLRWQSTGVKEALRSPFLLNQLPSMVLPNDLTSAHECLWPQPRLASACQQLRPPGPTFPRCSTSACWSLQHQSRPPSAATKPSLRLGTTSSSSSLQPPSTSLPPTHRRAQPAAVSPLSLHTLALLFPQSDSRTHKWLTNLPPSPAKPTTPSQGTIM